MAVRNEVVARPTGVGVPGARAAAPVFDEPDFQLARALSSLSPSLDRFTQSMMAEDRQAQAARDKEEAEKQSALGAHARSSQADNALVPMTREQNPYWQQGYMRQHGILMGIQDSEAIEKAFEEGRNTPGFNLDQFLAQQRGERLKGFTDKDALGGYLPALTATEAKVRDQWTKQSVKESREAEQQVVSTQIQSLITDSVNLAPEDAAARFQALQAATVAKGILPRPEFTQRYVAQIVASQETVPQDFDHLFLPGPDGVIPADTLGRDGLPMRPHIEQAVAHAKKRVDEAFAVGMQQQAVAHSLWLTKTLAENPMAIQDPEAFVAGWTGKGQLFGTPGAAEAGLKEILRTQADWNKNALHDQYIAGLLPFPRGLADDPVFKKRVEQSYEKLWLGVDASNTQDFTRRITASLEMHERLGIRDTFIESLSKRVASMSTVPDKDGKAQLTPEFRLAYSIFKSLGASRNPQLASFNDESQAFLSTFASNITMGMPELDAFNATKLAFTPDAKARAKAMWVTAEEKGTWQRGVEKFLDSAYRANGNGWWPNVENKDEMARAASLHAENLVRLGTPREVALEQAQAALLATHAYDGHRRMVQIPPDVSKKAAGEFLNQYVTDAFAARPKQADKPYQVKYANGSYVIQDMLGNDIAPPKTITELQHRVREVAGNTPDQIAARQQERADIVAAQQQGTARRDREYFDGLAARGVITPEEHKRVSADIDAAESEAINARTRVTMDRMRNVPQFPSANTADSTMRAAIANPKGPELSTKQIVKDATASNPDFALTAYGEGFRNSVYLDSAGKRTIGLGYNLDARDPQTVLREFHRAGIVGERAERVMAGQEAITPEEGRRLYDTVAKGYEAAARAKVGDEVWSVLPPNRRAALTDIAYNAGGNSAALGAVVDALKAGKTDDAIKALSLTYRDAQTGERKLNTRRMNLILAMWESPEKFLQLVNQGI